MKKVALILLTAIVSICSLTGCSSEPAKEDMTENYKYSPTQEALMYFYKNPTSFKKEDVLAYFLGMPITNETDSGKEDASQYMDLEEVSHAYFSGVCESIFVDKNTGVLYIEDENHSLTPIYNADGSLKNISDCE